MMVVTASVAEAEPFRLEDWLNDIGVTPSKVSATAKQLRENDFDDRVLLQKITVEELKECGVTSVGIRKCILEAVRSPVPEDTVLTGFKCNATRPAAKPSLPPQMFFRPCCRVLLWRYASLSPLPFVLLQPRGLVCRRRRRGGAPRCQQCRCRLPTCA
jgi:hypothetical protein